MRIMIVCFAITLLSACDRPNETAKKPSENNTIPSPPAIAASNNPQFRNVLNLPSLAPAERFTEYAVGEQHRDAQDALNAGDLETAYNAFGKRNRSMDGPREKRFDDVLEIAFQQWSNTTPSSDYVERVETYWLPELRDLPVGPPMDETTCKTRMAALEELAQNLVDGEALTFTPKQAKTVGVFAKELRAKKAKLLPILQQKCG